MYRLRWITLIFVVIMGCLLAGCNSNQAGKTSAKRYEVKSEYLIDPDKMVALADQSAAFWINAYDAQEGGFFAYVGRDGSVDMSQPYKITSIQSRDAYSFARAYQLTGKNEYLDYARKALDFMYEHSWDKESGGWFQELNRDGSLPSQPILPGQNWNNMKWLTLFDPMKGISAMADATRNSTDTGWMQKSFSVLQEHMWDDRPDFKGYYDMALADWSEPSNKTLASAEGGLQHYLMIRPLLEAPEAEKDVFLSELANVFVDRIIPTLGKNPFGVIENFDSNWSSDIPQPSQTNSGNFLKPAWCLAMAYLAQPEEEYRKAVQALIDEVLYSDAYDSVNKGFYSDLTFGKGKPVALTKCWWIVGQTVFSGLIANYITGNDEYLKMADESMMFYTEHFYDYTYGEVYGDIASDGTVTNTEKGNYFKGGGHSMELYYYTYLYGNLMLNNEPVTLYYYIEPSPSAREIVLTPVELGSSRQLTISEILLDGKEYSDYDRSQCLLNIPGNTGGEFKVTFKPIAVN